MITLLQVSDKKENKDFLLSKQPTFCPPFLFGVRAIREGSDERWVFYRR